MKDNLTRKYGMWTAISLVVGIVIGSGIYTQQKGVFEVSGYSITISTIAWLLGGIVTIFAGLTVAEIASETEETGGLVTYIYKFFGKRVAFVCGLVLSFVYLPGILLIISWVFVTTAIDFIGINTEISYPMEIFISLVLFSFAYLLSSLSNKAGGILQLIFTIAKIVPLVIVMVLGIYTFFTSDVELVNETATAVSSQKSNLVLLASAFSVTAFAYDGWILVGTVAGEIKNPSRNLVIAIVSGIGIVTIIYVLINISISLIGPIESFESLPQIINDYFPSGEVWSKVISFGMLVSIYGGINGLSLVASRTPYGLAIEKNFIYYTKVAKVNSKSVPVISVLVVYAYVVIIGIIFMFLSYDAFINFVSFPTAFMWAFYILTFLGVIINRYNNPNKERTYKTPLFPFIPILSIAGGLFIIIPYIMENKEYGLVSIILALVFYGLSFLQDEVQENIK